MRPRRWPLLALATVLVLSPLTQAKPRGSTGAGALPKDPRDIPGPQLLEKTRAGADLDGDGVSEILLLVNALTGAREPEHASEVIVGILGGPEGTGEERAALLWARHVAHETGRPAHSGEIAVVDLDGDGGSELMITWDRATAATKRERWTEIWCMDAPGKMRKVWEGIWEIDTRRDPDTPDTEKQRFSIEVDFGKTRRLAGRGIVLKKTHVVIAGKTLEEPRVTLDTLRVRLRP